MITLLNELEKHATVLYQKIRIKEYVQRMEVRDFFRDFDEIFHQTNEVFPFPKHDPLQIKGIQTFSELLSLLHQHLLFYRRVIETFLLLERKRSRPLVEKIDGMLEKIDNMRIKR